MASGSVREFRELPALLFLAAMGLAAVSALCVTIWFAAPKEPVLTAGLANDYSWDTPQYVPIQNDVAVFLVRDGEAIIALDATSPTSHCRIGWVPRLNRFVDPCCGAQWSLYGTEVIGDTHASFGSRNRYDVQVGTDGRILVYPWRSKAASDASEC